MSSTDDHPLFPAKHQSSRLQLAPRAAHNAYDAEIIRRTRQVIERSREILEDSKHQGVLIHRPKGQSI